MSSNRTKSLAVITVLVSFGLGACGDSVGVEGGAAVTVLLTDAPIDYVGAAMVDIGVVELISADGGPPVTLSEDGTDGPVNLLELQNAATLVIAQAEIEAGSYAQLRLIVESASVTLADGYVFDDGSTEMELRVPSGAQTGIKLNLGTGEGEGALEIVPGEMVLVLDFDVSQSFVIQGNPETPAGINSMSFKPTLRVVVENVAGTIAGTVSTALTDVRVDSLTVTAEPVDEGPLEAYQTRTATAMTRADGTYTLQFLVPGTYSVTVTTPTELLTQPDTAVVAVDTSENVANVDFALVASGI